MQKRDKGNENHQKVEEKKEQTQKVYKHLLYFLCCLFARIKMLSLLRKSFNYYKNRKNKNINSNKQENDELKNNEDFQLLNTQSYANAVKLTYI